MRALGAACFVTVALLACAGGTSPSQASRPRLEQAELTQAPASACTPLGPEICLNARDDNCNGIVDESCGLGTGFVQFVIAWDKPRADVDLYVTAPNGELAEAGHLGQSGLVKERDCPGRRNECRGKNLENVFLEPGKELEHGRFRVRIRLENMGDEEPPIHVTFGARLGSRSYAGELSLRRSEEQHDFVFDL
jgi:hypothetical protein